MDAEKGYNEHRKELRLAGLPLLALSWQTLGIIYSDIGTSPLYVLNGIWPNNGPGCSSSLLCASGGRVADTVCLPAAPAEEDVIGGISAIVWSLTLLPYVASLFVYHPLPL
jgi:KUP system potassium uptake protein